MGFLLIAGAVWLALLVYSIFSAVFGFNKLRRVYLNLLQMLYQVRQGEGGREEEGEGKKRRSEGREEGREKGRGGRKGESREGERGSEREREKEERARMEKRSAVNSCFVFDLQLVGLRMKPSQSRIQPEGTF